MKTLSSLLLALTAMSAGVTNAAEIPTSTSNALSICKKQASIAHEGFKSARLQKVKKSRGIYKVKLRVVIEGGTEITMCEIDKEGAINYYKK